MQIRRKRDSKEGATRESLVAHFLRLTSPLCAAVPDPISYPPHSSLLVLFVLVRLPFFPPLSSKWPSPPLLSRSPSVLENVSAFLSLFLAYSFSLTWIQCTQSCFFSDISSELLEIKLSWIALLLLSTRYLCLSFQRCCIKFFDLPF